MNDISNKNGGKVLASGGFGCIFSPALKCKGSTQRKRNTVSKLMISKNAKKEFEEISKLNNILNKIPNYKLYFLIDNYSICQPSKLTNYDLKNFDKCKSLKKEGINKENINKSLDHILSLNMPYAGITVESFIFNYKSYDKIIKINNKLIDLLLNGIIPMNNANIYHNDIKDSNILIDESNTNEMKVRLIDWNLTVEYVPFKNSPFPKNLRNRPLQFNNPFSNILFTDMFYSTYSEYLKKNSSKTSPSKEKLEVFIKNYIKKWNETRGPGHLKYINKIMYMLFSNQTKDVTKNNKMSFIEEHFTNKIITEYLVEILINFTSFKSDGRLNMREYLDNVYIKILDIWGLIISYFPLYELLFENYKNLNKKQSLIFSALRNIFLEYLYKPRIQAINIDDLVNSLKNINKIIQNKNVSNKLVSFRKKINNSVTRKKKL
jgi:hypothetical protein